MTKEIEKKRIELGLSKTGLANLFGVTLEGLKKKLDKESFSESDKRMIERLLKFEWDQVL